MRTIIRVMRNFSVMIFLLVLAACTSNQEKGCTPPPEDFTEADLAGVWEVGFPEFNDTLIIRENGTYKQIIHDEFEAFDYESDWQPWRIEYRDNGIPFLYLEGMRMCVTAQMLYCNVVGGGTGLWIDHCRNGRSVGMPAGEGVLMVIGTAERFTQPPRGFRLSPFSKSYEFMAPSYYFTGP